MALTRYREGSLRELLHLSLPLMLSSFSVMAMIFVDRSFLARYSMKALNSVANSMTLGWAFIFSWMVLSTIGEVFVARRNGSGQYKKIGEPVWQMIWLGLFSILFFCLLAIFGPALFYGSGIETVYERTYFQWMVSFGPSFVLYGALTGFFIGRGKTQLVTSLALGTNILNAILDYFLIFGVDGLIEPMGVKGAAIATCGSALFQTFVLFAVFINRHNRETYNTAAFHFQWPLFKECVRIGFPFSVFVCLEMIGWAFFYRIMTDVSDHHITVAGITQSVLILLFFFSDGISKAATAIAGNMLGAQKGHLIRDLIKSGLKLHLLIFGLLLGLFFLLSDGVIAHFLPPDVGDLSIAMADSLKVTLLLMCIYLFFEGVRMLFSGVLTAAGDTMFLLIAGTLSLWILMVVPTYVLIKMMHGSVELAMSITAFYAAIATLIYWLRAMTVQQPPVEEVA